MGGEVRKLKLGVVYVGCYFGSYVDFLFVFFICFILWFENFGIGGRLCMLEFGVGGF